MDKEDVVCVCVCVCVHTMDYYSAIRKKKISAFVIWMDLYSILSEISQRETNTIRFHLYVESKKQNKTKNMRSPWVAQSVEPPTPDFGSGHNPRAMGSSPMSGSVLSTETA